MKPRRFGSYEWVLLINTFVDSGAGFDISLILCFCNQLYYLQFAKRRLSAHL